MRKYKMELVMACFFLICFYFLSRQAAAVSVWMNSETVETKKNVIVLDPGHGGSDPGMIGVDGLEEKGINLSVSLLLKEKLEEKGYTVMLTRESDQGLYDDSAQNKKAQDMQRRIALIDETAPVLTVSIHQNSYHDPMVKGPQVFYYETSSEGKELAADLQESLNTVLEVERPREIKGNTSYYLLKRSKGLLVIAECGFLTNPEEAALLQTEEYQGKVASALAEGILAYLQKQ
nr:N-acetylmuramoyl-L-alanine amidase [uncultured Blautia sp.]